MKSPPAVMSTSRETLCIVFTATLISGFHRALLESNTFINRLNALNYTKLRV